jgi:signal transduction histidine kinase/CheY-like chemotaxis protein/AraC-like DNA-binding protein
MAFKNSVITLNALRSFMPHRYFLFSIFLLSLFHSKAQDPHLKIIYNRSIATYDRKDFDSSIVYADQLLAEAEKTRSNEFIIKAYTNKASSLNELNKTKEAIVIYYKALSLCASSSENNLKAHIYSNLGAINFNQGNYATAKSNYKAEIGIRRSLKDIKKLVSNLINLSAIYRRLNEFDSSAIALKEIQRLLAKTNDEKLLAYYYNSIGAHYTSLHKNDTTKLFCLDSAQANYKRALNIWVRTKNDEEALRPLFNLGYIYQLKKEPKIALANYLETEAIVEKLGLEHEKITVYGNIAELYCDLGDFKKGTEYFRAYIDIKNKLQKKEINDYAIKLDKRFQTEKEVMDYAIKLDKQYQAEKNKEIIQNQKLEINQRDKQLYLILLIGVSIVAVLVLMIVYFNFQKRVNKKIEEAKKKFFSNVVHEIRTPLSMISAPLKVLKSKHHSDEDAYTIDMAERNIKRLDDLINQMLDISKIESTKYTLSETFGDLEIFFNDIIKNYTKIAAEKSIIVMHQFHLQNRVTFFDKDALEKITGNLLSNAIKYTPSNRPVGIDVYTEENEAGLNLVITVWDTGVGISEKEQEKIFNRFYRSSETATTTKGVGIGLSLVKDLVELHRGDIKLKSERGKGSVFTINLTLKTKDNVQTISTPKAANVHDHQIMLIEDDADILEFNSRLLEQSKFKVVTAKNGKEALVLLERTLPDLIITDLMMPEMDGLSFLRTIRSNSNTDHIPVVVLSAKAAGDSKVEALKLGAQAYLAKPFLPDELIGLVTNQLEILTKRKTEFKQQIEHTEKKVEEKFVGTEPYTQKLFALIFKDLDNPELTVEGLADQMATNRSHFQRKIKSLTGFSPSELIKSVRLEKAKELLLTKTGNITEVAYQCGFSSQSYFTKCFTQHFGVSPTQMLHKSK